MPSASISRATAVPNDLEAYWLPFTPNRAFKASPRLIARAKDMYYYTPAGRAVLDGTAGLWCTNAGHNRDPIVAAIRAQAAELDYAPAFQFSHPKAFGSRAAWPRLHPATSTTCSSATPDPRPWTQRSISRSRSTMYAARARVHG